MKKYFLLFAFALVVIACSKKSIPSTTTTQTTTVTASAESIAQGKLLVEQYCVKCHKEPLPANYSVDRWNKVLPAMYSKAKLEDAAQQQLIHDYVFSILNSNPGNNFLH